MASGTLLTREAMFAQSSVVAVGMMSSTSRSACSGEAITFSWARYSPGVVQLQVELQPVGHRGDRHAVDVVGGLRPCPAAARVSRLSRAALGVAAGGEVGHLVVVPRDAHLGGSEGIQFGEAVGVGVGDGIDGSCLGARSRSDDSCPSGPHHPYSHP